MARRSGRLDIPADPAAAVRAMRICRDAMLVVQRGVKISGPVYRTAGEVVAAIDTLTMLLTGDATYFSMPVAISGGGTSEVEKRKQAWEDGRAVPDSASPATGNVT